MSQWRPRILLELHLAWFSLDQPQKAHRPHPFPELELPEYVNVRSADFPNDRPRQPGSSPELATCLRDRHGLAFCFHRIAYSRNYLRDFQRQQYPVSLG